MRLFYVAPEKQKIRIFGSYRDNWRMILRKEKKTHNTDTISLSNQMTFNLWAQRLFGCFSQLQWRSGLAFFWEAQALLPNVHVQSSKLSPLTAVPTVTRILAVIQSVFVIGAINHAQDPGMQNRGLAKSQHSPQKHTVPMTSAFARQPRLCCKNVCGCEGGD